MFIQETNSTNDLLKARAIAGEAHDMDWIAADYQTAGRGQAGNSWESERGKNLLFSIAVRPTELPIDRQFRLSMLVSVAITNVLNGLRLQDEKGEEVRFQIKWPNDIYSGDRKTAGILIENMLSGGRIGWSIAGVGLNVNQREFTSNAPNPVSLTMLTNREFDRESILKNIIEEMKRLRPWLVPSTEGWDPLKATYWENMYRNKGFHKYVEREVSTTPTSIARETEDSFEAEMTGVTEMGELELRLRSGEERKYHFKQVRFVVNGEMRMS